MNDKDRKLLTELYDLVVALQKEGLQTIQLPIRNDNGSITHEFELNIREV